MAEYNPGFWEVATDGEYFERVPAERGMWFEDQVDRERRYAMQDFFQAVKPVVTEVIESCLTSRQREVVLLYFFYGKTQEDIAAILDLTQSTVSRHLFGTMRNGKKVGGAIQKLKKAIDRANPEPVALALDSLRSRMAQAV